MLAFWGLLAVGVVALVRTLGREDRDRPVTPAGPRVEGARAILDGRFARGEIDADEYERRRDLLSKRSSRRSDRRLIVGIAADAATVGMAATSGAFRAARPERAGLRPAGAARHRGRGDL